MAETNVPPAPVTAGTGGGPKPRRGAVERELAARYAGYSTTGFLMCSCGYAANNPVRFHDHLTGNPDHEPRYQP